MGSGRLHEEKQLFLEYHRTRDQRTRRALIERYLPLARSLARRYRRGSEPLDDLEQVASLALVKAVDGFSPSRGTAFSSYAVPSIVGAIKRHFRDCSWSLHVPRDLQDLAVRVQRLSEDMSGATGRAPTAAEIAERAGVAVEEVLEARDAYRALTSVSLDHPRGSTEADAVPLGETLDAGDTQIPRTLDRVTLDSLLGRLDDRERLILRLYYQRDLTQAEIGRRFGYSQMHVSRIIRQAVARLAAEAGGAERGVPTPTAVPGRSSTAAARRGAPLPPSVEYLRRREGALAGPVASRR